MSIERQLPKLANLDEAELRAFYATCRMNAETTHSRRGETVPLTMNSGTVSQEKADLDVSKRRRELRALAAETSAATEVVFRAAGSVFARPRHRSAGYLG